MMATPCKDFITIYQDIINDLINWSLGANLETKKIS